MSPRFAVLVMLLALAAPLAAIDPAVQTSIVLTEGDVVAGAGPIEEFDWTSVSPDGHVLVHAEVQLTPFDSLRDEVLLIDGTTLLRREGDDAPGIAGSEVLGPITSAVLDESGRLAWTVDLRQQPGSAIETREVVYLDDTLVLSEGDVVTWPGNNPGTTFVAFEDVRFAGGRLLVAGFIDDPTLPGFSQPFIGFVDPVTGAQEKVVARGDAAPSTGGTVTNVEVTEEAFLDGNAAGQVIYKVTVDGQPGGSEQAVYLDGTLLALGGTPSVVPGRDWSSFSGSVGVSESGEPLFVASLDGDPATSTVIVRDGVVVTQSGVTSFPEIAPGTLIAPLGKATLGDDGDVAYQGLWSGASNLGLVLNDRIVVREDVTSVEGQLVLEIEAAPRTQRASRDGRVHTLEIVVFGGLDMIVRLERTAFEVVGGGVEGTSGLEPLLRGDGSLAGGTPYTFTLSGALSPSSSWVIAGFSELSAPFKAGLLVPSPDIVVGPIPTDGFGGWKLSSTWPTGVPSGFEVWLQAWVSDPGAPVVFAGSDGLVGTTP